MPQGLYLDPTVQLRALQEYVAGQSPTFNTLVVPAPDDLARDHREWVIWWPPGMGVLLLPLLSAGIPLAIAVRVLAAFCYLCDSVGWALWCAEFRMPRPLSLALAAALPLSHFATTPLFQYYTESFNWAFVPWILLGSLALARLWHKAPQSRLLPGGVLLGSILGFLYWLKYSVVFVTGGVVLFFAWLTWREWRSRRVYSVLPP